MKRLAITTLCVLLAALAICTAGMFALNGILEEAHDLTIEIFTEMERGNVTTARELLVELSTLWEEESGLLSLLCSHDDLHDVKTHIIQAKVCIEYTDMEDFFYSISLVGEGIEHIRDAESLTPTNLY